MGTPCWQHTRQVVEQSFVVATCCRAGKRLDNLQPRSSASDKAFDRRWAPDLLPQADQKVTLAQDKVWGTVYVSTHQYSG